MQGRFHPNFMGQASTEVDRQQGGAAKCSSKLAPESSQEAKLW